jgi:hypothetical protein
MRVAFLSGESFSETEDLPFYMDEVEEFIDNYIKEHFKNKGIVCHIVHDFEEDEEVYIVDLPVLAGETVTDLLLELLSRDVAGFIEYCIDEDEEALIDEEFCLEEDEFDDYLNSNEHSDVVTDLCDHLSDDEVGEALLLKR